MITPLMVGRGRAGHAIARSLQILASEDSDLPLGEPVWLSRGESLKTLFAQHQNPLLCIANPHGLHARTLLDAEDAGFRKILCEKPVCVNTEEVRLLRKLNANVAVFHGYRQMWGPQTLKELVDSGELGEVFTIEGKYWQSSTAEQALDPSEKKSSWKNDIALSGRFDVYLDLATHWADLAMHLAGAPPLSLRSWRSYINADADHRDSHVLLVMDFGRGTRAMGSISKTVHGATNEMEIMVMGSRRSAGWHFLKPDEITLGEGRNKRIITRKEDKLGSCQAPFHALGWLEGYVEICRQAVREMFLNEPGNYPRLETSLSLLEKFFAMEPL